MSTFPAPIYRKEVLTHIFAEAQQHLLPSLLEVDYAHLLMLHRQGIVTPEATRACLRALRDLDRETLRTAVFDGSFEDLFFLIEHELGRLAGPDNAGRLHTARSRNDVDLTVYRMSLRSHLLGTLEASLRLRSVLLRIATIHSAALMPAYTHNQPAQPTTLGHYLMAMVEILERDAERLVACFGRVNRSPLGACAITTTGFLIDREYTASLLGFRGLVVNSYGAIAAVDYVAEAAGVVATAMLSLGRFTQDMLLWSTAEFGLLRLSDAYVQISSIMPQKRNPVPLEHTRILASRALTGAQSVLGSLHNTPFADMNDAEDPLLPLVSRAFADAAGALSLLAGILDEATFNTAHMHDRAAHSFLTVTEVADTLVRETGIAFAEAHALVSAAVRSAPDDDPDALARDLEALQPQTSPRLSLHQLREALDPAHFVAIRKVTGGPAPEALAPEFERAGQQHSADLAWLTAERSRLAEAHQALHVEAERLLA